MWAAFLMAMIALLLAFVPFTLFFYGETIRSRSRVVQELAREEAKTRAKLESRTQPSQSLVNPQIDAELQATFEQEKDRLG